MSVCVGETSWSAICAILPDAVRLFERDSARGRLAHTYAHTQQFERLIENGIEDLYERPASEALPHIRSLTSSCNCLHSHITREFILPVLESIADRAVGRIWDVYGRRASGRNYFGQRQSREAVLFVLHDILGFSLPSLVVSFKARPEEIGQILRDNFRNRPWACGSQSDVALRLMVQYGVSAQDVMACRLEALTMTLKEYVSAIVSVLRDSGL